MQRVGSDDECSVYYNETDYCTHSTWDGAIVQDDDYYANEETVHIDDAAGYSFDIKVDHLFTDEEAETYYDHVMAGKLSITINGEDVGEEWMHDVDDTVNTHVYYYSETNDDYYLYENPDYDGSLVVRMECTNDCVCTFVKTE